MTKKKREGLSDRAIRALPYESRIQHYNREKTEMFAKYSGLPAWKFQEMHEELRKKWDV